jgi:hypothetical protein
MNGGRHRRGMLGGAKKMLSVGDWGVHHLQCKHARALL